MGAIGSHIDVISELYAREWSTLVMANTCKTAASLLTQDVMRAWTATRKITTLHGWCAVECFPNGLRHGNWYHETGYSMIIARYELGVLTSLAAVDEMFTRIAVKGYNAYMRVDVCTGRVDIVSGDAGVKAIDATTCVVNGGAASIERLIQCNAEPGNMRDAIVAMVTTVGSYDAYPLLMADHADFRAVLAERASAPIPKMDFSVQSAMAWFAKR